MFFSSLMFSLSFNLDNIVVGAAYGIKKIRIGPAANLTIATITTLGTFVSMLLGNVLSGFLPAALANALGAGLVMLLGLYFVLQSLIGLHKKVPQKELALKDMNDMIDYAETSDKNRNGKIEVKEAFWVALGLMINNLGTGIAASISAVNIWLTTALTFVMSLTTILLGEAAGRHALARLFGKYAPLFSGLLLVLLGIIEFLQ